MRVKLTAKHPRPDSPSRQPVRPGAKRDATRRSAAQAPREGRDADQRAPAGRRPTPHPATPAGGNTTTASKRHGSVRADTPGNAVVPRRTAAGAPARADSGDRSDARDARRAPRLPGAASMPTPTSTSSSTSPSPDRRRTSARRLATAPTQARRTKRQDEVAAGEPFQGTDRGGRERGASAGKRTQAQAPARRDKPDHAGRKPRQSPAQALAERIGARSTAERSPARSPRERGGGTQQVKRAPMDWTRASRPRADAGLPRHDIHRGIEADVPGQMRLSKRMSELGLCSRREADEWIEKGWVRVDGQIVDTLGAKVTAAQHIDVLPNARAAQARQVTIVLNKPVGYVSGQPEGDYPPAVALITPANRWSDDPAPTRFSATHLRSLAPAGRLDIDSTGLLVLTQDGRIAKQLIGEQSEVEKEYLVRVRYGTHTQQVERYFPIDKLAQLREGLSLDGVRLKPAQVDWQNGEQLRFVLREGRKRQIRRMCELVGLEVVGLKRVRIGQLVLGALPSGKWRYLRADEHF
ncbi:Ribosomal large subunit pseudouridine synthase F (EC 4.2.1.70) [Mycetohabitans rhizoxinica HKI 454]|uniref:Dual-specificity RNA pseudouridine synthase RluF n=1 Tax=Mycetohabitans rhizoxinica (strain DSM 19002 / CIP 109453 / HKI 454) TaxID=882378 RepID=E5AQY6_MYCRK|nr:MULTISPECIES: pseudouridine synthase [Mycetohabitans]MCF7695787.1 pseudouridine synthase [Mycetohabitans sp. B2]MCG1047122.1 pseudouridine synthase [Mycetohabitans sp. B6]CBW75018.1 Ribosomal large subunit pseudouridine synthase F (EC 4.2.1.70) [Mycetohabitans rhizoxinica HKI 454]